MAGTPAIGAGGASTFFDGGFQPTVKADSAFVGAGGNVVVAFTMQGGEGPIAIMTGPGLAHREWVYPQCDPTAIAGRPATSDVFVLCVDTTRGTPSNVQVLTINASTAQIDRSIALPAIGFYNFLLVFDSRIDRLYCVTQPGNGTSPSILLGVDAQSGQVVSNTSVPPSPDIYDLTVAVGPVPGDVEWANQENHTIEIINASSGRVLQTQRTTAVWIPGIFSDLSSGLLYVSAQTLDGGNTTVLYASNLSVLHTIPIASQWAIPDDVHGDLFLMRQNVALVVRQSDWAQAGAVNLPPYTWTGVYDSQTDQLAGPMGGDVVGLEATNISRSLTAAPGFSAVPVLGESTPIAMGDAVLAAGAVVLALSSSKFSSAWRARQEEFDRRLKVWLREGGDFPPRRR